METVPPIYMPKPSITRWFIKIGAEFWLCSPIKAAEALAKGWEVRLANWNDINPDRDYPFGGYLPDPFTECVR